MEIDVAGPALFRVIYKTAARGLGVMRARESASKAAGVYRRGGKNEVGYYG